MASAAPSENNNLVCVGPVKRGRPEVYTDELAQEICERIAAGETLTAICADDHIPALSTIAKWLMRRADFSEAYAHARETQAHVEAEQIRDIADNAYEDYYIDYKQGPNGERIPYVVVNNESIKRAQLRIATRQWRMERLNRRAYAASVKHEHSVDDPARNANAAELPPGIGFLARHLPEGGEKP